MSQTLQERYEDVMVSGVAWAGKIPAHWDVQRLGRLFRESSQRASTQTELGYPILSVSIHDGISDKEMDEDELDRKVARSEDRSLYKVVEHNDLAYNMMRAWQGGFGAAQVNGLISPAYVVCKPRTRYPSKFFELLLRTPTAVTELKRFSRGITDFRLRLYWDDFKKIEVPVPPKDEQEQILKFLDYETAKIDALIAMQQQLIALLGEKRQAVISHAVTKGLNPDAPMRDSGVEWLGEVPAHWDFTPLGYLTHEVTVGIVVTPAKYYVDKGVPCLRSLNVRRGFLRKKEFVYISSSSNNLLEKSKVYTGDVVVVRTGQPGTAAVISEDLNGCNCIDLIIIRRSPRLLPELLVYQLNSDGVILQIGAGSDGAIQQHFNVGVAKKLQLLRPPLKEQEDLVRYLDDRTQKYDLLINKALEASSLLKERRTALISAAVTGNIDVRNWKPPTDDKPHKINKAAA